MKKVGLTLEKKRSIFGYVFLIPWLIGIVAFFIYPLFKTFIYGLGHINLETLKYEFTGILNFQYAFKKDAEFPQLLANSILDCLKDTPLILCFSFAVALVLRKNFKGSFIVKSIFFITVIMSSDVFLQLNDATADVNGMVMESVMEESQGLFNTMEEFSIEKYLIGFGVPTGIITFIDGVIQNVSDIIIHSGIQIFVFLAALHSIPDSMFEASSIEGATAWENLWKITFPLMTPFILVNLVYTIVDSFITLTNPLLKYIYDAAFKSIDFGYSSAMAIIYFIIIGVILGIVMMLMRKKIYFQG